ncbi:uncharacterized protein EI90DRAFT_3292587 [Cantharellus anzutake]|uniref:uncharacterized protein n=1 Tax=Cantharellus anzutake TaxID=1750568 RepID=UPI0019087BA1|nr:uncharacterized protein EI90DRAFT_3292587 [Cantharellus anzutake]KAF8322004.1 hypothetical protein EI90DRAFT_3292587 [Cantharellus anzutake]
MNYYEALEVPSTASADVIKDRFWLINGTQSKIGEARLLQRDSNWQVADPEKRSTYDLSQRQTGQGKFTSLLPCGVGSWLVQTCLATIAKQVSTCRARACPKDCISIWPSATWYELSAAPGISFCSFCYEEHIAVTQFGQAFREVSGFPPRSMNFGYWAPPTQILFKGALETGDLSSLAAYLEVRASIPDCSGARGYIPGLEPRMEWFTLKVNLNNSNDSLSGFIVCRACYEDVVMATPHHIDFRKHLRNQLPDQVWTCDVGYGWARFVFDPIVPGNRDLGWNAVVTKLCSGFRKKCYRKSGDSTDLWWRLRDDPDFKSLAACDPCHKRFIAPSDHVMFESVSRSEPLISPSNQEPLLSCAMRDSRPQWAWENVRFSGLPTSTWRDTALVVLHCEPCTSEGEVRREWYRITSSPDLCNICSGCYYTVFYTHGFGSYFYRDAVDPDVGGISQRRVCDLNPDSPRYLPLGLKIDEASASAILIFSSSISERGRTCTHAQALSTPTIPKAGDGMGMVKVSLPARNVISTSFVTARWPNTCSGVMREVHLNTDTAHYGRVS